MDIYGQLTHNSHVSGSFSLKCFLSVTMMSLYVDSALSEVGDD